eukprot:4107936-Ditylum_brightwellii.AAC.1
MLTFDSPYTSLTLAPLKSKERCKEKVKNEYNGDFFCVIDIVCPSIVVADEDQLITIDVVLQEQKVVWLKNCFKEPLFNGYSDVLYNLQIYGIVCEVQIHISAFVVHNCVLAPPPSPHL